MERTVRSGGDERQVDLRLLHLTEFDLGLLGRFLQTLHGHAIGREIDTVGRLELRHEPIDDALVPVVAAEAAMEISSCC